MANVPPMILVVDDHPDSCDVLRRLLSQRGLEAKCAQSAHEATALMEQSKPNVIVLDDMMPDTTGLTLLKQIRDNPEWADIKVIFYSAVFDFDRKREAQRLGVKDWLVKGTVRMSDLIDLIAEMSAGQAQ
jgi:CheY-like chemotaxis protein